MRLAPAVLAGLTLASCATSQQAVEDLDRRLLSQDSATATLQAECDRRGADGARIMAEVGARPDLTAAEAGRIRAALQAADDVVLETRSVRLSCRGQVLSNALNVYRPDLLTAEMNRRLATSTTPFGVVVADLGFRRRTLSSRRMRGRDGVLQHRAVLTRSDGRPFSYLVETYTPDALPR